MNKELKSYLKGQKASGIKVGDKVRVIRSAKSHSRGWSNSWIPDMDKYLGYIFTVDEVEWNGIRLDCSVYSFPYFALERVGVEPKFKVGDKVKVVKSDPDWFAWNDHMNITVGKNGIVKKVNDNGAVRVQFEDEVNFYYRPEVLSLVKEIVPEQKKSRINKETKVEKLMRLQSRGHVSFVVETPGTETLRPVRAVVLRDFTVKKTKNGNHIVCGRDVEYEECLQMELMADRVPFSRRVKSDQVFRCYRVDRILNATIN